MTQKQRTSFSNCVRVKDSFAVGPLVDGGSSTFAKAKCFLPDIGPADGRRGEGSGDIAKDVTTGLNRSTLPAHAVCGRISEAGAKTPPPGGGGDAQPSFDQA